MWKEVLKTLYLFIIVHSKELSTLYAQIIIYLHGQYDLCLVFSQPHLVPHLLKGDLDEKQFNMDVIC